MVLGRFRSFLDRFSSFLTLVSTLMDRIWLKNTYLRGLDFYKLLLAQTTDCSWLHNLTKTSLEPCHTSMIEIFAKITNGF